MALPVPAPRLTRSPAHWMQVPEDEDDAAGAASRSDLLRLARDASVFLGASEPEESAGAEMKSLRPPVRPRFDEDDDDG